MQKAVRSIYSAGLQTANYFQKDPVILPNSTLNQKFNLHTDQSLNPGEQPITKYLAIGQGGHQFTLGNNSVPVLRENQHTSRQPVLYNHVPFIIRPLTNDLSPSDRIKYRMRVLNTVSGIVYVYYYLKVLDISNMNISYKLNTVSNGNVTVVDFVPTLADLNPTPPPLSNSGVNVTTGDYLTVSTLLNISLSLEDINELLNVYTIINGDVNNSVVSEIGLFSGVDRNVSGTFNSGSATYVDVIQSQIAASINSTIFCINSSGEDITMEVGNSEPLLNIQSP